MNKINNFYKVSKSPGDFAKMYIRYLSEVLNKIKSKDINNLFAQFDDARINSKTIFVAGNGGSSTTATTMANDIGFDIIKKTKTKLPFRVLALTDNNAVMTAIANDISYDEIFLNQLKIHFRKNDKLILISASGNSKNLIKAASWVKKNSGTVIAFLGFDGGKLKNICDYSVLVPTNKGEYGPVEDAHLILNHILAHWYQNFLPNN